MTKEYAIGIDLGGTNARVGLVNRTGRIVAQTMQPVGRRRTPAKIIALIEELVDEVMPKRRTEVIGIGCGVPGIVDVRTGTIGRSPHYPQWKGFALCDRLAKALHTRVVVDNDANMSAVGEHRWGAAKGMDDFVILTFGTGIGGGIVIDGELYRGPFGYAGEIGHMVIEREGSRCDCGSRGCWEEYAAASFFKRRWGGGKDAEEAARVHDRKAIALWKEFGRNVGIGISNLIHVLGITNFVIGGGLSRAARLFIPAARAEIMKRQYPQNYKRLNLIPSKLVDAAGILGAAASVFT